MAEFVSPIIRLPALFELPITSGLPAATKFISSVFALLVGDKIVKLLTVIEPGKLVGVDDWIATALKPEFVIITDCDPFGKMPNDQFDDTSQLPLAGFIQEFTCARAEVEMNVITDATKQTARPIAGVRQVIVRIEPTP